MSWTLVPPPGPPVPGPLEGTGSPEQRGRHLHHPEQHPVSPQLLWAETGRLQMMKPHRPSRHRWVQFRPHTAHHLLTGSGRLGNRSSEKQCKGQGRSQTFKGRECCNPEAPPREGSCFYPGGGGGRKHKDVVSSVNIRGDVNSCKTGRPCGGCLSCPMAAPSPSEEGHRPQTEGTPTPPANPPANPSGEVASLRWMVDRSHTAQILDAGACRCAQGQGPRGAPRKGQEKDMALRDRGHPTACTTQGAVGGLVYQVPSTWGCPRVFISSTLTLT